MMQFFSLALHLLSWTGVEGHGRRVLGAEAEKKGGAVEVAVKGPRQRPAMVKESAVATVHLASASSVVVAAEEGQC